MPVPESRSPSALPRHHARLFDDGTWGPYADVYLASEVDARAAEFERAFTQAADAYGALQLQHAEVESEIARLAADCRYRSIEAARHPENQAAYAWIADRLDTLLAEPK